MHPLKEGEMEAEGRTRAIPCDVLIITAADGEDKALQAVDEGAVGAWEEVPKPEGYPFTVRRRKFAAKGRRVLSIMHSHAYGMGGERTANVAGQLQSHFKPRCLAMCGICGGRPGWTNLGDVVIADKVYRYDSGEQVNTTPGGKPIYKRDITTYNLAAAWLEPANTFPHPTDNRRKVHVGPMGTGNDLQRDVDIWDRLSDHERLIRALDMEASAVGHSAYLDDIKYIVVKGVMDHAEPGRRQNYRARAARAAAETLIRFLRENPLDGWGSYAGRHLITESRIQRNHQNPGTLLRAENEVVPFDPLGREREVDALKEWCEDGMPISARLFTGPGGAGKTRLLFDWCKRMRDKDWEAGLLPLKVDEAFFESLGDAREDALLAVDYAESRSDLAEIVKKIVDARHPERKVRIALLAREEGDWFTKLVQEDARIESLFPSGAAMRLREVPMDGTERARIFLRAFRAFKEELKGKLEKDVPESVPELSDERFGRMLYLHMAALASVLGLPADAETLVETILNHERHCWAHAFETAAGKTLHDRGDFMERASRSVAAFTLWGGCERPEEAEEINRRAEGPAVAGFTEFLSGLYPHFDSEGRQDKFVHVLEPDLLGEALVAEVLSSIKTRKDFLARPFVGAPENAVRNAFVVLGRIAFQRDKANDWMAGLLNADVCGRAMPALEAAMALGQESANSKLGFILAESLMDKGTSELAQIIDANIPRPNVSLREVNLWAVERQLRDIPAEGEDQTVMARRARLLSNLGYCLAAVGHYEKALKATRDSVELFRELVDRKRDIFLPNLAMGLNNLGGHLSNLGRHEEALEATQEAVKSYRELAARNRDAFLPGLAMSLDGLGDDLSALGRDEEALKATGEGAGIYRSLAKQNGDDFEPPLAMSLVHLGNRLSESGYRKEALAATREAMDLYQKLVSRNCDSFLPGKATSLDNLGGNLSALGNHEEALKATREAEEIWRNLVERNREAFLPNLAASLSNLGFRLSDLGRHEEALQATQEAVKSYRELAARNRDAFLPDLAMSLNNLGVDLLDTDRETEALPVLREAAEIWAILVRRRTFSEKLMRSLRNLERCLKSLKLSLESDPAYQEGMKALRENWEDGGGIAEGGVGDRGRRTAGTADKRR
jgi:tetratricopeptide (TPR) repeat protein/nucleoside phosphorylase